jgi:hypothetical protein
MISNPYAYFDKNSEYHHQNPVNDNSYDCQADYNAISVVGNSSGGLADNTSAYVPVLFSPTTPGRTARITSGRSAITPGERVGDPQGPVSVDPTRRRGDSRRVSTWASHCPNVMRQGMRDSGRIMSSGHGS